MPMLLIKETGTGAEATAPVGAGVITIGRDHTNDIVLEFPTVAEHHCEIEWDGSRFVVRDFDTPSGTFVGNRRVNAPLPWNPEEFLRIGTCQLSFIPEARPVPAPPRTASPSRVGASPPLPVAAPTPFKKTTPAAAPVPPANGTSHQVDRRAPARIDVATAKSSARDRRVVEYKTKIREYIVDHPEVKRLIHTSPNDTDLRDTLRRLIREAAENAGMTRPTGLSEAALEREMVDEILGLGPLEDLMKDDTITEIMVNRWDQILVERAGAGIEKLDRTFLDENHLLETVRRMLAPLGRHLNESSPLVDARLKDGTRINAVIPPISIDGCLLTVRKFSRQPFSLERLLQLESITPELAELLRYAVRTRLNIIVSGGTGTGKTCFLNALAGAIPPHERMLVIEDTHELRFEHPNCVYLEARPANLEGKGAIAIRRLVINSLRMRPDRIIVGECRGDEAFDMLQAMNTGHLGSMTTVHANSPRDALMRIENMTLMAGYELPSAAIRRQIASAIHVIVQLARLGNRGERRVTGVSEVSGVEGQTIAMQDLYSTTETGELVPTGSVPKFLQRLEQRERVRLIRAFGMGE